MKNLKWWQKAVIYEIYLKSFYDSNNDGIGDLRGVLEQLDYLKSIGISTIWITPFYPSGGEDSGYDITSFVDIDPVFGTMNDFDELVTEIHKRDMYIIIDFIPNHTSTEHFWFKESSKNNDQDNPYRDYYVWYQSEDKINPPNNWVSIFEKCAWTYHEKRKAWYFHQFLSSQPELNFRCSAVRKEIEDVIKFWIEEKSVDGLRVDAARFLFENENFADEPLKEKAKNHDPNNLHYDHLDHIHTTNQPETFEILIEWKKLLDEIGQRTNTEKFLVTESYDDDTKVLMDYYQYKNRECSNFTFNFQFIKLNENEEVRNPTVNRENLPFKPKVLKDIIDPWINNLKENFWTNWQIGNHDFGRIASRIGQANVDLANVLCLLLGGTATTYYGEEIGMENLPISELTYDQCQDYYGKQHGPISYKYYTRDYSRTPMQWSSAENTGFTVPGVKPWLPIHKNYKLINVEKQLKEERSHLKIYKDLVKLRQEPSFQWGDFKYALITDNIFSFYRFAKNYPKFLVVLNTTDDDTFINFRDENHSLPQKAKIKYFIGKPFESKDIFDLYSPGKEIPLDNVHLKGRNCLILTF